VGLLSGAAGCYHYSPPIAASTPYVIFSCGGLVGYEVTTIKDRSVDVTRRECALGLIFGGWLAVWPTDLRAPSAP
jgi:hypothetical protein